MARGQGKRRLKPEKWRVGSRRLFGLERRLGVKFRDKDLLKRAMTHSSLAAAIGGREHCNETLEFLGDAVLGFLVSEMVYRQEGIDDEGAMTKLKANLVSERSLAKRARTLSLGAYLRMAEGEDRSGGREKPSILADAYEALLGAVYLDLGVRAVRKLVKREFGPLLAEGETWVDFKSRIQVTCHRQGFETPTYRLLGSDGPPHRPRFQVACRSGDRELATAKGPSKKEAEQRAAEKALASIDG